MQDCAFLMFIFVRERKLCNYVVPRCAVQNLFGELLEGLQIPFLLWLCSHVGCIDEIGNEI